MSRNTKIILGIVVAVIVVCVVTAGVVTLVGVIAARNVVSSVQENMDKDPAQVEQTAAKIASFEPPAGFAPAFSMDLAGVVWVYYEGPTSSSHLMIVNLPSGTHVDPDGLQRDFQKYGVPGMDETMNIQATSERLVTIAGQDVTVQVAEQTNSSGEQYHLEMCVFEGKSGPVLISINTPLSVWDQADVDAFYASIR
jgi:hypothetical protein